MTVIVTIADNASKKEPRNYTVKINEVDALVVKDSCNICTDEQYTRSWDRICDYAQNQCGVWNDFPDGYIHSIMEPETDTKIY